MKSLKNRVVVAMGSKSDLPVMKEAVTLLESWGVKVDTQIISAHRTPRLLETSVQKWESKNVKVIIAGAGGAAHLPGMLASFSHLPIIGVPISTKSMNGLDSLLSISQMPKGIPVATVAVNGGFNAGLLALQILGIHEKKISGELIKYKRKLCNEVSGHRRKLQNLGINRFLKQKK